MMPLKLFLLQELWMQSIKQYQKGLSLKKVFLKFSSITMLSKLFRLKEILPKAQKTLEEAKGSVISDYQNDKEEKWVKTLADKYKVVINKDVLKKVKSQIEKQ